MATILAIAELLLNWSALLIIAALPKTAPLW